MKRDIFLKTLIFVATFLLVPHFALHVEAQQRKRKTQQTYRPKAKTTQTETAKKETSNPFIDEEFDESELEEAISLLFAEENLPEGMKISETDSLLKLYYNETYLRPDDDCNFANKDMTYTDEEYIEKLSRLPYLMEMPYNQIVRKFIDRYTNRMGRSVSVMLGSANFYMPIFEEALEAYGVPLELKYLPVIESALNPKATSPVGAAGLWQFMPATGKQYGLEINTLVDERRDPIKSSYAAARLLRDLYRVFNDWSTVIAAYNCGPGNVNKAIKRAGGTTDYWKLYPFLPKETRGYVPAFIAANYAMNYYCDHGICPMRTKLPAHSDTIMVSKQIHMKQISEKCGISLEELRTLNPQYRKDIVNGSKEKPAILRLPDQFVGVFIDNIEGVAAYRREELLPRRDVVVMGE